VDLPGSYIWRPRYDGSQVWNVDPRNSFAAGWQCLLLVAVLAIPAVGHTVGVPVWAAAATIGVYGLRCLLTAVLEPRFRGRPRALEARLVVEVAHGTLFVVAPLVVATGDPTTPLWALAPLYAALDGSDFDFPPLVIYAALHALSPLATIPFFLASNAPTAPSIAAPVLFSFTSFMAYQYTASRKVAVRVAFAERDALRERIAHERTQLERERVVHRLTTSVAARLEGTRGAHPGRADRDVAGVAREGVGDLRAGLAMLATPQKDAAPAPARPPIYRAMPAFRDRSWNVSRGNVLLAAALSAPVAIALSVPAVASAFGLRPGIAGPIAAIFPVWTMLWAAVPDRARGSRRGAALFYVGSLVVANVLAVALPVSSGDPRSALWALSVMYATFNGSDYEVEPSILHLVLHCGAPVATIPIFVALGAPIGASIGAPLFFAVVDFVAFDYGARRARVVREARAERERLAAELDDARASRDRERLARDLHDSVGSSLSLAAVYGDLLERARGDARASERLAAGLADAADQGLDDLRALLEGLAAEEHGDLAAVIGSRARRLAAATGVAVSVRTANSAEPGPAARFALLRIAQEAVANALRHAQATHVEVVIGCDMREARLTVSDDGEGISPAAPMGRGLANMRARAEELGGALTITPSCPRGTRVEARVPARAFALNTDVRRA